MSQPVVAIKPGKHWFVDGATGAGKTFWTKNWLLPRFKRQVVWDSEDMEYPDEVWRPASMKAAVALAKKDKPFRVRIRAPVGDAGIELAEMFSARMLDVGHDTVIVFDEYADLNHSSYIQDNLLSLIRKGRKRNLTIVAGTQRSQDVQKGIYTQAAHHVFFYMDEADVWYWHEKARYLPDLMPKVPYESFRWIYHSSKTGPLVFEAVEEHRWA